MMRAARLYAVNDIRVDTVPLPPAPPSGWVRLKVEAAGICGSDLTNFRAGLWITRSPSTAGHEFVATVTELGPDVSGLVAGDRVVTDSRMTCGACTACRTARPQLCAALGYVGEVCDGGFAEETILPARLLHKSPPGLRREIAAMAEPLAVALHTIRRLRVGPDDPILIAGCGTIGGFVALILSKTHRAPILVADNNGERARLVAAVAGARIVSLTLDSVAEALGDVPLLHAVEATGSIAAFEALTTSVAGGGAVALVGIFHDTMKLNPNLLVDRELSFIGCQAFSDELPDAIGLLPSLTPELDRLIDRRITLEEVPETYERLIAGRAQGLKTIILL